MEEELKDEFDMDDDEQENVEVEGKKMVNGVKKDGLADDEDEDDDGDDDEYNDEMQETIVLCSLTAGKVGLHHISAAANISRLSKRC